MTDTNREQRIWDAIAAYGPLTTPALADVLCEGQNGVSVAVSRMLKFGTIRKHQRVAVPGKYRLCWAWAHDPQGRRPEAVFVRPYGYTMPAQPRHTLDPESAWIERKLQAIEAQKRRQKWSAA